MKRRIPAYVAAAAVILTVIAASCAKERKAFTNEDAVRFIEAWLEVNHPGDYTEKDGIYIFDSAEKEGEGKLVDGSGFVFVNYTVSKIDGSITESSLESVARQMGTWTSSAFYGPKAIQLSEEAQTVGLENVIKGMKVGGKRTALIPRWMDTSKRYDDIGTYKSKAGGDTDYIYEIEVIETIDDIIKWQIDSIERYIASNRETLGDLDSLYYGFYFKSTKAADSDEPLPVDTTCYVNYTGRLLNGSVFDTNIEKTAKIAGIYKSGRSYEPSSISWAADSTGIKMSGSSVITGFASTLWHLKSKEAGIGIFVSSWGYGASGSAPSIPAYAPLMFEVEMVDKPEN